jgi:hypothetical protein
MPPKPRKPPSQTWRTFLDNHIGSLDSIDFFTVPTATFRILYVFLVLRARAESRPAAEHGQDCGTARSGRAPPSLRAARGLTGAIVRHADIDMDGHPAAHGTKAAPL